MINKTQLYFDFANLKARDTDKEQWLNVEGKLLYLDAIDTLADLDDSLAENEYDVAQANC